MNTPASRWQVYNNSLSYQMLAQFRAVAWGPSFFQLLEALRWVFPTTPLSCSFGSSIP